MARLLRTSSDETGLLSKSHCHVAILGNADGACSSPRRTRCPHLARLLAIEGIVGSFYRLISARRAKLIIRRPALSRITPSSAHWLWRRFGSSLWSLGGNHNSRQGLAIGRFLSKAQECVSA